MPVLTPSNPPISHLPFSAYLPFPPGGRGGDSRSTEESPALWSAYCPRVCPFARGSGRVSARERPARGGTAITHGDLRL